MSRDFTSKAKPHQNYQQHNEYAPTGQRQLREVDNTVNIQVSRKKAKNPLKIEASFREQQYLNSNAFNSMTEQIIQDSKLNNSGSKIPSKPNQANLQLNAGGQDCEQLEEVSQKTLSRNSNFFQKPTRQTNKIYLQSMSNISDIEQIKIIYEKQPYPSVKSQPKLQYCLNSVSIFEKIQKGYTLQCELHRDKKSLSGMTEYNILLQKTKEPIITVRKEGLWQYVFYMREKKSYQYTYSKIATLESTFLGNKFTLIKYGQHFSNGTICYESNFLGLSGPRKMHIYLPKTGIPLKFLDECYGDLHFRQKIEKCINKQARWQQKQKSYVLSLNGRAKLSSIKNFVITDSLGSEDKSYLIFGKAEAEVYNLDIQSPFSLVQGIAVALTTFEHKVICD